jgi:hypothetical protein
MSAIRLPSRKCSSGVVIFRWNSGRGDRGEELVRLEQRLFPEAEVVDADDAGEPVLQIARVGSISRIRWPMMRCAS